jgi:hypothetical protein
MPLDIQLKQTNFLAYSDLARDFGQKFGMKAIGGPVRLALYVSSSAVDTNFTGKLVDVWPNGFAQNLTDGILRARYRNSMEKAE